MSIIKNQTSCLSADESSNRNKKTSIPAVVSTIASTPMNKRGPANWRIISGTCGADINHPDPKINGMDMPAESRYMKRALRETIISRLTSW
jgi:hypothetical protein